MPSRASFFIPQGELVMFGTLMLASLQLGKVPITLWLLLVVLGLTAMIEAVTRFRRGNTSGALLTLGGAAVIGVVAYGLIQWIAPLKLPLWIQVLTTLLDEPSLGLAPLIVRDILNIVKHLRDDGVTVLLVEQNARASLAISDEAYVMETGQVKMSGPATELAQNPELTASYLGG